MITKSIILNGWLKIENAKIVVTDAAVRAGIVSAKFNIYTDEQTEPVHSDYVRFNYNGGNLIDESEAHAAESLENLSE